ncbi:MAG TPA: TlpA disulfide reductase family protein [Propionibacteriaceae bacterium]|nr:TlpA disulfide reductase family protein [Propionibacteriaceae bacterium]
MTGQRVGTSNRLRLMGVVGVVTVLVMAGVWLAHGAASDDRASDSSSSAAGVGHPAPDFSATTIDGSALTLSSLRGQPVWLIFNATWCADCRAEAPDVQALHASLAPDGLQVVAVYLNEEASVVREWTTLLGLTFIHVPDPDGSIASAYVVPGVPTHYFIDATGTVRSLQVGSLTRDAMAQAVSGLGD